MDIQQFPKVNKLIRDTIKEEVKKEFVESHVIWGEDYQAYLEELVTHTVDEMLKHNINYLYSLMDSNGLILTLDYTYKNNKSTFRYVLCADIMHFGEYTTRNEAEKEGFEKAIQLLEEKL